jgi:4-hydroxy-3-methylbut-2-enyl diphosphate reductase
VLALPAPPHVEIDPQSGFCFGVVYAIAMAEDVLDETGHLYCLGDIVHNDEEVARLAAKGLRIIEHRDLETLRDTTVLIRAHGEPPSTYETAIRNNLTLVDASCPVVLKLQNRVRKAADNEEPRQIVIYGKPGHAEVNGLLGQLGGNAIVVSSLEELDGIDISKPIELFSQTTKSTANFYALRDELERRGATVEWNDTICRQVSNREPQLERFAAQYDAIVFVSGKKSSNGKVLHDVCKRINPRTYFVSNPSELQPEWFEGVQSVGICGATSTPQWVMEQVQLAIQGTLPPTHRLGKAHDARPE